jgi:hypothetical protein
MRKPKSRPDGYVKHLVSVCIDAGMTMDEVHFGTRIPKSHLRSVAYSMNTKFRSPYNPIIQYYVQPEQQV